MSAVFTFLKPLTGDMSIGVVGGFIIGYGAKKVARMVAVAFSLGLFALQLLAYKEVITIDYSALQDWILSLLGRTQEAWHLITDMIVQIPLGTSFALGFFFGLHKG